MAVTVREVLDDALVATAEPQVEVAGDSLDNPVRWVFTNEREDVASFLAGGELLVVEGRSLVADGREKRADEYVKSLVNADIAALMVELVEEVTQLPKMLVKAAKHEGLTIIGLRRRIPFVDICQSVNTMIVRDQMRMQMQVDVMSTSLRSELAQASNPKAVADGIANLFGEDVVIFDVDGLEVARAGQNINTATDCGIVLALEEQKRPLGALEISQRNTVFDEAMCRRIEQIAAPVLTLYLDGGARVGMVAHLIAGPEDGVHVSSMEAREGHAMLDALGFAASGVYMPFAMKLKSVANAMPAIVSMIDDFESNGGCESICLLEGDLMIGFLAAQDSGGDVSVFSDRCLHALTQVAANEYVYTVHGRAALDTISLMDAFGALRSVIRTCISNDAECPYGTLECVDSSLLERMLGMERTDEAVRMVITQTVGHELMHNAMLIDTLCACFDNLDNKTGACEQLGIQRQTLYNRLDKVTQIVGIAPTDKISWSMLLLVRKWRNRNIITPYLPLRRCRRELGKTSKNKRLRFNNQFTYNKYFAIVRVTTFAGYEENANVQTDSAEESR